MITNLQNSQFGIGALLGNIFSSLEQLKRKRGNLIKFHGSLNKSFFSEKSLVPIEISS